MAAAAVVACGGAAALGDGGRVWCAAVVAADVEATSYLDKELAEIVERRSVERILTELDCHHHVLLLQHLGQIAHRRDVFLERAHGRPGGEGDQIGFGKILVKKEKQGKIMQLTLFYHLYYMI